MAETSNSQDNAESDKAKKKEKTKEEPSSMFQRRRVDMLLGIWTSKFPPKAPQNAVTHQTGAAANGEKEVDVKSEKEGGKESAAPSVKSEKTEGGVKRSAPASSGSQNSGKRSKMM